MSVVERSTKGFELSAGQKIRVTQTIRGRDKTWVSHVDGVVDSCQFEPTGSWYAHGKNDRLWLQRVRLRKDDGEITVLVLDPSSRVDVLSG